MSTTKIQPGGDLHLTLLMAPHSLNFVTGADRAALLAYGRDVFAAGQAGAVPAAVAGPTGSEIAWDVLPENPGERDRFERQLSQLFGGDPRVFIATSLRLWAETRGSGFFGAQCAVFANEVAKMHIAAPALEAPAAPATPEQVQALHRARRALHAIGKTYDDSELRTRALEADEEIDRLLAAAPQAPAEPTETKLPTVRLLGVKAGTETDLGEVPMPPSMRMRELLRDYGFTDLDDVMSQDASALGACEDLIAYCQGYFAAAPAAPAVDAASDTALLDATQRHRIALVPEFEGPWDAEIYNDDAEARPIASGNTPREALRAALAAQATEGGAQ